jgi:hypothetical protein
MAVMSGERRVAKVLLSARYLVEFMKTGVRPGRMVIENGLPLDADIVGAAYNVMTDCWEIGVESATFDPVSEGVEPPTLPPVIVRLVHEDVMTVRLAEALSGLENAAWLEHGWDRDSRMGSWLHAAGVVLTAYNQVGEAVEP